MKRIVIPGNPIPQPRHRISGNRRYIPKKHLIHAYKQFIQLQAKKSIKEPMGSPIILNVTFYIRQPKTCNRTYPTVRPDLDNYMKGVMDALNGILYYDDSQIIRIIATKQYSNEPRTVINIHEIT